MTRTLDEARETLVAAIRRDTPGSDLPRLVNVLDKLIAWSEKRAEMLAYRPDEGRGDALRYELVGSKVVFWAAQVTRGVGPRLEIYPPTGRSLSDEDRATVLETLNAHSREVLVEGDRLRIGFGALKNEAARKAVLALMDDLLATSAESAGSSR